MTTTANLPPIIYGATPYPEYADEVQQLNNAADVLVVDAEVYQAGEELAPSEKHGIGLIIGLFAALIVFGALVTACCFATSHKFDQCRRKRREKGKIINCRYWLVRELD